MILTGQAGDRIEVRIVWVSGHYSLAYARPLTNRQCDVTGYEEMVKRTGELWEQGLNDRQIADQLTAEGFPTARSTRVPSESVQRIRLAHGWQLFSHQHGNILEWRGRLTALGLAARLGVKRMWVYRRLRSGQIDPRTVTRHPQSKVYLIQDDPETIEPLRQLLPEKQRAEGGT